MFGCRQVKVGEVYLTFLEMYDFRRLRLLDTQDHFSAAEYVAGRIHDLGTGAPVVFIFEPAGQAGLLFD